MVFQSQIDVQLEEHRQSMEKGRTERKLDIAYKYAELNQKSVDMAGIFLREVAKETAIGFLYRDSESGKAKIWIRNDANLLIGRSPSCDIVLTDQHVSREHCVIHTSDNQAFVVPLQPTNAVLIDGEAISRKTLLPDGCRIKLGTIEFHFYHFQ